jgi:hypothetical protein
MHSLEEGESQLGNWRYAARRAGSITGKFRTIEKRPEEEHKRNCNHPSVFSLKTQQALSFNQ